MAQVLEFKLPDLGEGLTEAEIVRWLVSVGDVVAIDQPVVEVETAKAMVEVPCPYGGVVTARYGEEGTELPVGAPLLTVAVGGTGAPEERAEAAPGAAPTVGEAAAESAVSSEYSGNVLVGYGTAGPAARRRRVRHESHAVAKPSPLPRRPPPRPRWPFRRRSPWHLSPWPRVGIRARCRSSRRSFGSWPGTGDSICATSADRGPRA